MTDKERVRKVFAWLIFSGKATSNADIAQKLQYSESYLSTVGEKYSPLNEKFVNRLVSLDENLNKVWILKNEGEFFISAPVENKSNVLNEPHVEYQSENDLVKTILSQQHTIESQQRTIEILSLEGKKNTVEGA